MNDAILFWNDVALEAARVDFGSATPATPPAPEQPGPTATSRALAIVHLAMHDAYLGTLGQPTYLAYTAAELPAAGNVARARVAAATAACVTLSALFRRQEATFLRRHAEHVASTGASGADVDEGLRWGGVAAARLLADRSNDGSANANGPYAPSTEPYRHRADPNNPGQGFLGAQWGSVRPFCVDGLTSGSVTLTPPPAITSQKYADDFNKVKVMGGVNSPERTPNQTTVALFWAYDGARDIGVPPRLYNQAVRAMADAAAGAAVPGSREALHARLFAAVNAGMADAGIVAWYEKYTYNIWRPVIGVREADGGWGPSGRGDGNSGTTGDPYWSPLGAPQTNGSLAQGLTPSFPAYPSGHATFGTVALRLAQVLLGVPSSFRFKFVSEELNGSARGAQGVRVRHEREFTVDQAIQENILSRVYMGVHWEFDGREGEAVGEQLATLIGGRFPARAP